MKLLVANLAILGEEGSVFSLGAFSKRVQEIRTYYGDVIQEIG
jgi:hypothetical protein